MKNLIVTACDLKYGDFLVNHWLKSLKDNVNLRNIDILVLDYGLTENQVKVLKKEKVIVKKCVRNGHVVNLRFRDIYIFLSKHKYDQVLSIDGGDVIFQDDISHLFNENKKEFRVVVEKTLLFNFFKVRLTEDLFEKEILGEMKKLLLNKNVMIGAGIIIGPANKFKVLAKKVFDTVKDKEKFWPDQMALNYFLFKDGFVELDNKYDFVLVTNYNKLKIKEGVFYFANGEKIPIVHNAGGSDMWRVVRKFGYGKEYNKRKKGYFHMMRLALRIKDKFNKRKNSKKI